MLIFCFKEKEEGQGNVALFNGERAVGHDKFNIAEVCVLVCKLLCREAHIVGAGISAACGGISAESEVVLCVQRIADGNIIAGDGLLGAVVGQIREGDGCIRNAAAASWRWVSAHGPCG